MHPNAFLHEKMNLKSINKKENQSFKATSINDLMVEIYPTVVNMDF